MRRLQATFLLLLFITSFGRCWADTIGLLQPSPLSCCEPPAVTCCHEDHESDDHSNESDQDAPLHEDCELCDLLQSGFTTASAGFDLPVPSYLEIVPSWDEWEERIRLLLFRDSEELHPPPLHGFERDVLTTSEMVVTSTAFVRGPNLG